MLLANPVAGEIKPDKRRYKTAKGAVRRPPHSHIPLVTLDFGPSKLEEEPATVWPGGESNILGEPIAAKPYDHFHRGIDISTGMCAGDVLAAAPGTVRVSDADESHAQVIVIDHQVIGGHHYETRYAHLKAPPAFLAPVGKEVVTGTVIGKIGRTGKKVKKGCHLHFAITKDGHPVDPWRRLAQNGFADPDALVVGAPAVTPVEVPDVPIPARDEDYLAGQIAVIGNASLKAHVRTAPNIDAELVRSILAGAQETWLPTCWVVGDEAFGSIRWLTHWASGRWEFTHEANVRSVTPIAP